MKVILFLIPESIIRIDYTKLYENLFSRSGARLGSRDSHFWFYTICLDINVCACIYVKATDTFKIYRTF